MDDTELENQAFDFIKSHFGVLIEKFAEQSTAVAAPVSLFMAGSPGAGKTEVSRGLMRQFATVPIRIDADEIRALCPGYTGTNAHLFQKAATRGVHMLYDFALHKNRHVILDGTFAYGNAIQNIERSIKRGRKAELWFVYQDPAIAWEFTQAREAQECRRVTKPTFVHAFFKAQENVRHAKRVFGDNIVLNVLIKNIDNINGEYHLDIKLSELDRYIPSVYTQDVLEQLLV